MVKRHVESHITLHVSEPADFVFSIAVAGEYTPESEQLTMTSNGEELEFHELSAPSLARLHRVQGVPAGTFQLDYSATVGEPTNPLEHLEVDEIVLGRPSRYCDSDRLGSVAGSLFNGLTPREVVQEARRWVLGNVTYTPGSSRVVDGALETYLMRKGVCRDSAHLLITFCRAMGVPARMVSVYAPGLRPMDFHAVAEVLLDGTWYVVDGTGLAPRPSMVRIATGRDASDTSFLTVVSGRAQLGAMRVDATVDGGLPDDNGTDLVQLV